MTFHTTDGLRPVMPAPSALLALPRIRERGGVIFLALRPTNRLAVATTIERLIDFLDALDGDPDDEPYTGGGNAAKPGDHDRETDSSDDESSLGWPEQIDQEQRLLTDLPAFLQGGEDDGGDRDALRLFYGGDGVPTILWDGESGGMVSLMPTEAARRAI